MRVNHQAFFCSLFVARLADQVLLFLVPLVVFQTTRQVSWSGLAFVIETLPRYLVFPFFGALCDRISPLKLMRVSQTVRAVVCFGGVLAYECTAENHSARGLRQDDRRGDPVEQQTQPLAGLLVGVFSARTQTGLLIVVLSLAMGCVGVAVSIGSALLRRKRPFALGE